MIPTAAESSLANGIRQQINVCCQEFEQAWKEGNAPSIDEFVRRVAQAGQEQLLYELLILELNYRRDDQGTPLTDSQLCALHPKLMPEIAEQLQLLRQSPLGKSTEAVTSPLPASAQAYDTIVPPAADYYATMQPAIGASYVVPTFAREPRLSGSRGLHVRCPHCKSAIELLSDTPYESIKCDLCGSAVNLVDSSEHTLHAPTLKKIGRFELVSRLGVGGFGTVWKARDTELDRTVALKIPRKGQLGNTEIEQFFREARSAAQLQHPNIVPVHEVGRDGETIFIVSDLIRGVSLADWLSAGTPSPQIIARLLMTVAGALEHAHQMGVIHRDLKPTNLLMDESGEPHVMDFGLAKREIGEVTMTRDGHILGTPAYMSPEQAGGHAHWTDRRSDIYSMGVILFQMLTGELPFRGNASMQVHQRLTEDPPNPRMLNRFLPRDLCTICVKCLERDPNRRYSTANELAEELGRFIRHEPILSRPISRTERVFRWAKRKPALASAAALTVFLAVAGPITALVIENQRQRLGQLLSEKDNIIERNAMDKQQDANAISKSRASLALWEGRANPWQLWPPTPAKRPRTMLMERVVKQGASLPFTGRKTADKQQQLFGHLALAMMNDDLERTDEAVTHYQAARELLTEFVASKPTATQYSVALADCSLQLGRLRMKDDRAGAAKDLEQGRAINRRLAEQHENARLQAGWFESELQMAVVSGFEGATESLNRAQQISKNFERDVPKDAAELYELACYLGGREPILMTWQADKHVK